MDSAPISVQITTPHGIPFGLRCGSVTERRCVGQRNARQPSAVGPESSGGHVPISTPMHLRTCTVAAPPSTRGSRLVSVRLQRHHTLCLSRPRRNTRPLVLGCRRPEARDWVPARVRLAPAGWRDRTFSRKDACIPGGRQGGRQAICQQQRCVHTHTKLFLSSRLSLVSVARRAWGG